MSDSRFFTFWKRFRRNPLALAGLGFISVLLLVVVLGPFIRPDHSPNANEQHLSLSRKSPGFRTTVVRIVEKVPRTSVWSKWAAGGYRPDYREIPAVSVWQSDKGLHVVPAYPMDSLQLKPHYHPSELVLNEGSADPEQPYLHSRIFLLGTDKYGRDLLSRLMAGASVSLAVGAIAVAISLMVGLLMGLLAGYYRGWVDSLIMWFTNVVWSVPTLLLVMAITFAFGSGFWKVFLAVGLTMWVEVARVTRGQVLSAREKEYVEAARALGFRDARIIFRHILPNILPPLIVISAANFASAILIEAGLSFLGLGAQIPVPSWGNIIREHYSYLTTDMAYLAISPGLLIMLLVLSFMMIGNGLRDALDVRE